MRATIASLAAAAIGLLALSSSTHAYRNSSTPNQLLLNDVSLFSDRPDGCPECPSCFNCNTESDKCTQFAECSKANGKCICPFGFGGDDCSEPLCGSLADGDDRAPPKEGETCQCKDGWTGINCNVCETDEVCRSLMPSEDPEIRAGAVCYKHSEVKKKNFQMCEVTNKGILDQLGTQIPQVTFSCDATKNTCNFEFWIDKSESFYCGLNTCTWKTESTAESNTTTYTCENARCSCIPGRMLCGQPGSINLTDFLADNIRGPATFETVEKETGGKKTSNSKFQEPEMDVLIGSVFADPSIFLSCNPGECLYKTEVPGYVITVPKINTPLIAGIIAGSALFIVFVALLVWFLAHRANKRGAIYLEESDDERDRLLNESHRAVALQFDNVAYNLNGKQILERIQGIARPGQITAVMGASGAGKTTFLDILARKNKRGNVFGNFYLNGEKVPDADFKSVVGFVDQEDTMLPTLTVHETISISAFLRLPRDMSRSAKEQKVYEVEKQLGIWHIRDQPIGSEEGKGRGVSGGERRRVAIACELVTSPSILFLDEPTSGLDAYNAYNVIECLLNLARDYNRTVIFTIHQPRSNIVALFDNLVLLAKGRTVYSGPFHGCQAYFDSIGFPCPPGFNIADYLIDLTMHAGAEQVANESRINVIEGLNNTEPRSIASSVRAIKSINSASNISAAASSHIDSVIDAASSITPRRLKGSRRESIKQKQERRLYTRKSTSTSIATVTHSQTPTASRSDDEGPSPDDPSATNQHWLRLSRQQGAPPPQIMMNPDELPPPDSGLGSDLEALISNYETSEISSSITTEINTAVREAVAANGVSNGDGAATNEDANGSPLARTKSPITRGYARIGYLRQFAILSGRTWKNLYRNPMLMLSHYAVSILLAVLCGYLFYGLTNDIKGFQNRLGLLFFVLALLGFGSLTSLPAFAGERLLFMRERANGYYSPVTYFASKVVFDIVPLRLIPPIILSAIIYPMTGLTPTFTSFLTFVLVLVLFNLAAAELCLFIGIVFRDGSVANLVGSLVMLFSLLFAGMLLNHEAMPAIGKAAQKLSIFHYGFEALMVNEVAKNRLIDKQYGLNIEVTGAAILTTFGFNPLALWPDVLGLGIFSAVLLVLAYGAMHILLVEKR